MSVLIPSRRAKVAMESRTGQFDWEVLDFGYLCLKKAFDLFRFRVLNIYSFFLTNDINFYDLK